MTRLDGIDISHHQWDQGPVDIVTVRAIPTTWFACKATQSTTYVDPTMAKTRDAVDRAAFRHKLLYHWLASTQGPVTQAEHFLQTVGSLGTWGAMLDAEEGGITEGMCLEWCETVEAHTRRPCSIYSGLYVAGGTIWKSPALRTSVYGPRAMHLAAYVSEAKLTALMAATGSLGFPYHAWQFSSNGPVPGVVGRCDMNQIESTQIFDLVCGLVDTEPLPPMPPEEQHMAYFRDDRANGWQIWVVSTDAVGNVWTCPISDLPDHGKWEKVQPLVGDPPTRPLDSLVALMDAQNRPTPPIVSDGPVDEHSHLGGVTGPTGGVIRG